MCRRFISSASTELGRGITRCRIANRSFYKFQIVATKAEREAGSKRLVIQKHFTCLEAAREFALQYYIANGYPENYYDSLRGDRQ